MHTKFLSVHPEFGEIHKLGWAVGTIHTCSNKIRVHIEFKMDNLLVPDKIIKLRDTNLHLHTWSCCSVPASASPRTRWSRCPPRVSSETSSVPEQIQDWMNKSTFLYSQLRTLNWGKAGSRNSFVTFSFIWRGLADFHWAIHRDSHLLKLKIASFGADFPGNESKFAFILNLPRRNFKI